MLSQHRPPGKKNSPPPKRSDETRSALISTSDPLWVRVFVEIFQHIPLTIKAIAYFLVAGAIACQVARGRATPTVRVGPVSVAWIDGVLPIETPGARSPPRSGP